MEFKACMAKALGSLASYTIPFFVCEGLAGETSCLVEVLEYFI